MPQRTAKVVRQIRCALVTSGVLALNGRIRTSSGISADLASARAKQTEGLKTSPSIYYGIFISIVLSRQDIGERSPDSHSASLLDSGSFVVWLGQGLEVKSS